MVYCRNIAISIALLELRADRGSW